MESLALSLEKREIEPVLARWAARKAIDDARKSFAKNDSAEVHVEELAHAIATQSLNSSVRPVINGSGVLLHTGLGRARLASSVVRAIEEAANSHAAIEFNLGSGARGDRQAHVLDHLVALSGAESALVVNNCAAAVLLMLSALCSGQQVILSRGEMVEIGGSYRMPDVITASGARLKEVGCTNKTHIEDYRKVLEAEPSAILRCHPSNYAITGFTEAVEDKELAKLANAAGQPFLYDLGNGCMVSTEQYGFRHETTVQEAVQSGADLVAFSGDKLLGGPQAGILVGKEVAIKRLQAHPLARALRVDKLTIAALEATLKLYMFKKVHEVPVWKYASRSLEEVRALCEVFSPSPGAIRASWVEMGGGSLPGQQIPSFAVRFDHNSPDGLAQQFRRHETPIVGYVRDGAFWLDARTMEETEARMVQQAVKEIIV